ncbi:MAG: hypothetical protein RL217_554 [Pseudomonadota bacterium]
MKTVLVSLLFLVLLLWGVSFTHADNVNILWLIRQDALNLTGFLAISFMSLAVFLSIRPKWVEKPLGGLDRMYRVHKWAGIIALGFAIAHWFTKEIIGDILKSTIGKAGKVPKDDFTEFFEMLRHVAKDVGEWAFYVFIAMVVLALWKRFPYRPWQLLHKAMPVIYIALVFHGVFFVPLYLWVQPLGWFLAIVMSVGLYASVIALLGRIGMSNRNFGRILEVQTPSLAVVSLKLALEQPWHHRSGQFAFLRFSEREGAHPFTIASAENDDNTLDFHIKALGDFTQGLASKIQQGQRVEVEGPYGQFQLNLAKKNKKQVWIAGGIGLTPFLAWLESMQKDVNNNLEADLHYCTQDSVNDPFVIKLRNLCEVVPNVKLHIYGSKQGQKLTAEQLGIESAKDAEIWFCGPVGLADKLRKELTETGKSVSFHQELFEMR